MTSKQKREIETKKDVWRARLSEVLGDVDRDTFERVIDVLEPENVHDIPENAEVLEFISDCLSNSIASDLRAEAWDTLNYWDIVLNAREMAELALQDEEYEKGSLEEVYDR